MIERSGTRVLWAGCGGVAGALAAVSDLGPHRVWGVTAALGYGAAALLAGYRRVAMGAALLGAVAVPLVLLVVTGRGQLEVAVVERSGALLMATGVPYAPEPGGLADYNPYLPGMAVLGALPGDARWWMGGVFVASLAAVRASPWVVACPLVALPLAVGGVDLPVAGLMCLGLALAGRDRAGPAGLALGAAATLKWTAWPALPVALALLGRVGHPLWAIVPQGDGGPPCSSEAESLGEGGHNGTGRCPYPVTPGAVPVRWVGGGAPPGSPPRGRRPWVTRKGARPSPPTSAGATLHGAAPAVCRVRAVLRCAGAAVGVAVVAVVPVALADAGALYTHVVAFPLGLAGTESPAASPFPGRLLAAYVPGGAVVAGVLLVVSAVLVAGSLVVRPPRTVRAAAGRLALGLTLAIAFMPATRFGYLVHPFVLLACLSGRAHAPYARRHQRLPAPAGRHRDVREGGDGPVPARPGGGVHVGGGGRRRARRRASVPGRP
ncbi:hypothetical protein AB0J57_31400 [Streptomyces sp. NPDC049837]|uniref:hypothetical protein n=1 Tax=Streptomyces sp. NPDC049837 TaxID=3155277 RepID=UPI0034302543